MTGINAEKQIKDGSITEALLDAELTKKINTFMDLSERIEKLESKFKELDSADFLGVYEKAKSEAKNKSS